MTDQPEASPETPEEPLTEETVAETAAEVPAAEVASAEEIASAETGAVDVDAPEQPAEEAEVLVEAEVSETDTAETAAEPVAAEPVAEADTAEADTDEADTDEADTDESEQPELTLGEGAPTEAEDVVERPAPLIRGKIDKFGVAMGTGRRKTSVARVRIKTGTGKMAVNGRPFEEYFCIERDRKMVEAPLHTTETFGKVDVWVRVGGGGTTGQTGAVVLGIARALQAMDPALHYTLADNGYLTRDGRMVERKKYGFKKARKSFQFSKR